MIAWAGRNPRRGMKLVELMVVTAIVAIGVCVTIKALQVSQGRVCACYGPPCVKNMRQLGMALVSFATTNNRFPNAGTIFDDPSVHQGDPAKSNIYRCLVDPGAFANDPSPLLFNWVVEILPFLDQGDLANAWDREQPFCSETAAKTGEPPNAIISSTSVGVMRCPEDFNLQAGQGNLSYVVNGGFVRWPAIPVGWSGGKTDGQSGNGERLEWTRAGSDWRENVDVCRKLGVMFMGTHTGDQPWDIKSTTADISDGASFTLLVAENTLTGYSTESAYAGGLPTNWACPLPNFVMFLGSDDVCRTSRSSTDCLGGQLRPQSTQISGKGWAQANALGTFENFNYGRNLTDKGSFPFANSSHSGGGNFAFCDGSVRFLSDTIDGTVYAKLITPAGSRLPEAIKQLPLDWNATEFPP